VVSQGKTIEQAIANLKEAVGLYVEEMGLPEGISANETIVASFQLSTKVAA
jgi:predicted RNase H-like HicB family nuclease